MNSTSRLIRAFILLFKSAQSAAGLEALKDARSQRGLLSLCAHYRPAILATCRLAPLWLHGIGVNCFESLAAGSLVVAYSHCCLQRGWPPNQSMQRKHPTAANTKIAFGIILVKTLWLPIESHDLCWGWLWGIMLVAYIYEEKLYWNTFLILYNWFYSKSDWTRSFVQGSRGHWFRARQTISCNKHWARSVHSHSVVRAVLLVVPHVRGWDSPIKLATYCF